MLSYQHQFHAGNHADVLKHWTLVECLHYLQKKPTPFDYIDTHAGAGMYSLTSEAALKNAEFKSGIQKIKDNPDVGLAAYLELVRDDLKNQNYPGSPAIVNKLMRRGDHSWLFELHGNTFNQLEKNCAVKRQTRVHQEDGLAGLNRLLPVASRRALVLIDPSYEVKREYDEVVVAIEKAWKKMPQTMFLLWYPVTDRVRNLRLEKRFKQSAMRNVQLFEIGIDDDRNQGMTASGVIMVNPPWTLAKSFAQTMPDVSAILSVDGISRTRNEVLVPE